MPKYEELDGVVIEEYSPDGFSKVRIVNLGYEYAYMLNPITLDSNERAELDDIMERLSYRLKPKELTDPVALEKVYASMSVNSLILALVTRKTLD